MSIKKEKEQDLARELRLKGMSLPEIAIKLGVSKSSVSLWLRNVKVPEKFTKEYKHKAMVDRQTEIREAWDFSYLEIELPYKEKLEKMFNTKFRKERIGNRYCDFTNDEYVIELTTDSTNGVSKAINRLNDIKEKFRKTIILTDFKHLGKSRINKCQGDVYFWSLDKFNQGIIKLLSKEELIALKEKQNNERKLSYKVLLKCYGCPRKFYRNKKRVHKINFCSRECMSRCFGKTFNKVNARKQKSNVV